MLAIEGDDNGDIVCVLSTIDGNETDDVIIT